jgi:hypothetical protein
MVAGQSGTSVESLVAQRRKNYQDDDNSIPQGSAELWGIALSGGGIRSATFSLGLLRSLAEGGALPRFDVLSTVSGGGYVGSMLGKLLHHAKDKDEVGKVYEAIGDAETRWFAWWLRANGRYLIPRGVRDRLFALALFLRNLIGVHAEFAVAAMLLCAVLAGVNLGVWQLLSVELGLTLDWFSPAVLAWMPTLWLAIVVPVFLAMVMCCLYWALPGALQANRRPRRAAFAFWLVVVVVLAIAYPRDKLLDEFGWPADYWLLWAALLVLALAWMVALAYAPRLVRKERERLGAGPVPPDYLGSVLRSRATRTLADLVAWALGLLAIGLIERVAWFVAFELQGQQGWYGAALLFVATLLRVLLPKVAPASGTAKPGVGVPLVTLGQAVGWLLSIALLVWWISIGYAVIFDGFGSGAGQGSLQSVLRMAAVAALCLLYMGLTAHNVDFLNASSLHGFYRARLTRSYLGAANGTRVVTAPPARGSAVSALPPEPPDGHAIHPVSDVLPDDDIPMADYAPHAKGGLVHLLNVCLNETKDRRGGLFNQDRRGQPLTVGPQGMARIGLRPWAGLKRDGANTLGTWMAVSGAALAPGLGSMTRPGLSALTALTGLRLGFWWDSQAFLDGVQRKPTRPFPAKTRLLAHEILGRFGQGRRDWYLSDGGHFENTGVYPLLSLRASLIVLADCGADPNYRFADLENLVRKARVDLGVEITFLRPKGPKPDAKLAAFGSLNDLKLEASTACLALARICYRKLEGARDEGILIVVKPNVSADLPVDLHNFKADHPDFPQQSTTDQFFSESQWESYFTLGKVLGGKLPRAVLDDITDIAARCFVVDDGQPVGARASDGQPASARIPPRLMRPAVAAASVSLGAATTLGVATWQSFDSLRTEKQGRVAQERKVLADLGTHYGKLGTPASDPEAALPALAATLNHISDVHCRAEDVAWFHASTLAVCMFRQARELCQTRADRLPACATLISSSGLNCLDPERRVQNYVPKYWAVELYRPAPVSCPTVALAPRAAATTPPASAASAASSPSVAASAATAASAPDAAASGSTATTPAAQAPRCDGYTVYLQIYGGRQRDLVRTLREPWRKLGASVPPIDDVYARAAREGRKPPRPFGTTTVLYPTDGARGCAEAIARTGEAQTAVLRRSAGLPDTTASAWDRTLLSPSLQPSPRSIEVWISPSWVTAPATKAE